LFFKQTSAGVYTTIFSDNFAANIEINVKLNSFARLCLKVIFTGNTGKAVLHVTYELHLITGEKQNLLAKPAFRQLPH
jgi:hypothetical protein